MAYTTIDDPTAFFQTVLYTGNATARSITFDGNTDMQPDWVWGKIRSQSYSHRLFDSVRGTGKGIHCDTTEAEFTQNANVSAFNSNGFSLGDDNGMNSDGDTHVAWCWKAGTTSGLSGGSITPSGYSINTTAGFGIYKYTGNGSSGATIAHGLGAVPKAFFIKRLENNDAMNMYNESLGNTKTLRLDRTDAPATSSSFYNNTTPTSSLITLGTESGFNGSSSIYVMYAFAEKQGYSKFGSYKGNGQSSDGTFVYTGFRPAWIMRKNIDGGITESWIMQDNKRNTFNVVDKWLEANANVAEDTAYQTDFLSNGFKMRSNNDGTNRSATNYIYMAFAENPFTTSSGIPACAR